MTLWKRATGALKDQNSVMLAACSQRTPYRIPNLEIAIIKATSHDDSKFDYKHADIVFKWIRTCPVSLKPLVFALTTRMVRTQSWVVALKGLILIHGVFYLNTPAVQRIGRLPFDLSGFEDGHSKPSKMWGFNAFVRAYYGFLDNRSVLLYKPRKQTMEPRVQELARLQDWQALLDMLLLVKPMANNMRQALIMEAMDSVVIEIFDLYSRICNGITQVLMRLLSSASPGKVEAGIAIKVILKAKKQAEDLDLYFRFCKGFGVSNASDIPDQLPVIPEDEIKDLELFINGGFNEDLKEIDCVNDKALVVVDENDSNGGLKTIITEKWEVFDEDWRSIVSSQGKEELIDNFDTGFVKNCTRSYNPFETLPSNCSYLPIVPVHKQELPDLITL